MRLLIIETLIGPVEFASFLGTTKRVLESEVTYTLVPIESELPKGMAVKLVRAVLVKLRPQATRYNVRVGFKWLKPLQDSGDPQSGEWLEAQSWEQNGFIVMVGTEDYEALARRLPDRGLSEEEFPVTYHSNGIDVLFPRIPGGELTSLHFVVAENTIPEPAECSSWFAVDVSHSKILAVVVES